MRAPGRAGECCFARSAEATLRSSQPEPRQHQFAIAKHGDCKCGEPAPATASSAGHEVASSLSSVAWANSPPMAPPSAAPAIPAAPVLPARPPAAAMAPVSAKPTARPSYTWSVARSVWSSAPPISPPNAPHSAPSRAAGTTLRPRRATAAAPAAAAAADDRPYGGVANAEPQKRLLAASVGLPAVQHGEPRLVRGPEHERGGH